MNRVDLHLSSSLLCFHACCSSCKHLEFFTCSVQVEMCKAFGDPSKAKAWSKHSQTATPPAPAPAAVKDTESLKVNPNPNPDHNPDHNPNPDSKPYAAALPSPENK